jgi:hypothetical protein
MKITYIKRKHLMNMKLQLVLVIIISSVSAGDVTCGQFTTMYQDSHCCGNPDNPIQCVNTLSVSSPLVLSATGNLTLDPAALDLGDINSNIATLEGKTATLEGNTTTLEGKTDILEEKTDILEGKTDILEGKTDILEGKTDILEGKTTTLEEKTATLEGKTATLESNMATSQSSKADKASPTFTGTVKMSGDLYIMNTASRLNVDTLLVAQQSVTLNNDCPTCYTNTYGLVTFGRGRAGHDGSTYAANPTWPFACNDNAYFAGDWTEVGGNFRMIGGSDKEMIVGGTGAGGYLKNIKLVANDIYLYAENAGNIRMFGGVDLYGGIHFNYGSTGASDAKPSFHIGATFGGPVTISGNSGNENGYLVPIASWPAAVTSTKPIGLKVNNYVHASGYLVSSDERIKTNVTAADTSALLSQVNQIQMRNYGYVERHGTTVGFIAQELASVSESFVEKIRAPIPDIRKKVQPIFSNGSMTVDLSDFDVKVGEVLAVDFSSGQQELNVTSVVDGMVTVAYDQPDRDVDSEDIIGIYGRVVDDFHVISKDRIMATAVGALQEVDKTQQALLATVATLESTIAELTQRLEALEAN